MPACKFTEKKPFQTYSFLYFVLTFSKRTRITSSDEALKALRLLGEHSSFHEIQTKSSVTCTLPAQLRVILVNFLHVEYGIGRCLEYGFCKMSKLEFFVSGNTIFFYAESKKKALQEYSSFCSACMF